MNDRHTVDSLTSDALDALYERLEAAEDTESQRQLATAREALASATIRATRAEVERDGAYRERAHLVALLATLYPSVIAPALDLDEPGWWIAYLTIGGRQASWHISPRDAGLFTRVERVHRDDPRALWDGHTTDAKYEWLREHTALRAAMAETKEG
jgi:hypothetical protein